MLIEKLRNTTRYRKISKNKTFQNELSQNRKILNNILQKLQYNGFNKLINGAISKFQDIRVYDINFLTNNIKVMILMKLLFKS